MTDTMNDIKNEWNKECLRGGGGEGQNALLKIVMKQYLGHLMT